MCTIVLYICLVKHHYASTDSMLNMAMWLFQVWQTSNEKLPNYIAKQAGYLSVSLTA